MFAVSGIKNLKGATETRKPHTKNSFLPRWWQMEQNIRKEVMKQLPRKTKKTKLGEICMLERDPRKF